MNLLTQIALIKDNMIIYIFLTRFSEVTKIKNYNKSKQMKNVMRFYLINWKLKNVKFFLFFLFIS
jgi:hypothetical protein